MNTRGEGVFYLANSAAGSRGIVQVDSNGKSKTDLSGVTSSRVSVTVGFKQG